MEFYSTPFLYMKHEVTEGVSVPLWVGYFSLSQDTPQHSHSLVFNPLKQLATTLETCRVMFCLREQHNLEIAHDHRPLLGTKCNKAIEAA